MKWHRVISYPSHKIHAFLVIIPDEYEIICVFFHFFLLLSCQVFFVDYGNSEWIRESHVKRMLPHFLHLPFQALECFLGNVEPMSDAGENGKIVDWSEEAMLVYFRFKGLSHSILNVCHVRSCFLGDSVTQCHVH